MNASPILIPAIGAERASWLGLADISEIMPQGWSLAGGSMMRLLAAERSYAGSRSTHDIDVILDIRASRAHIRQFHEALSNAGFSIAGFNASGQNHRWVRGEAQIDILIPSGQSETARTYEYPGFGRLLETRGAQFGLERTRKASVLCANRQFTVNVPDGLGALYEKVSALLNNGDSDKSRHFRDIILLSSVLNSQERRDILTLSGKQIYRLYDGLSRSIHEHTGIISDRELEVASRLENYLEKLLKDRS
ncbi:hypothetical protein [Rothia mucilaginosa]|uniref:hypothetical protein n=1 Tax=Rothia mucilaginosa TaxID=43675 RepID=UPI0028E1B7B2|nr:hypothetical protein [Rothia mucilaginosa]